MNVERNVIFLSWYILYGWAKSNSSKHLYALIKFLSFSHLFCFGEWCLWYSCFYTTNFYPSSALAFGYCRCRSLSACPPVCPCVNHWLVRAITWNPFKPGPPNLDQRCETPWLRSLLSRGVIHLDLQVKIGFNSKFIPFKLVQAITHHPFKLGYSNLEQIGKIRCMVKILVVLGSD